MRLMILACGLLSCAVQAFPLEPYTATYQFNLDNKLSGTATRELTRHNDGYRYQFSATAAVANANEISDFRFDGKRVQSLHYENSKQVLFKSSKASVDFDWDRKQAMTQRKGEQNSYPLTNAITLDPLNLEIQIRQDLMTQKKPSLKGNYMLADPKGVGPLKFVVEGMEKVSTPYGDVDALKVSRVHHSADRTTRFWLAKSLNYLPVKVVQIDDGATYTIALESYQPAGDPTPGASQSPAAGVSPPASTGSSATSAAPAR